jgi:hypothetical protein
LRAGSANIHRSTLETGPPRMYSADQRHARRLDCASIEGQRCGAARIIGDPPDQAVGEVRAAGLEPALCPKHLGGTVENDPLAAQEQFQRR